MSMDSLGSDSYADPNPPEWDELISKQQRKDYSMANHPFGPALSETKELPWEAEAVEEKAPQEKEETTVRPVESSGEQPTYEVTTTAPDVMWGLGSLSVKTFVVGDKALIDMIEHFHDLWRFARREYAEEIKANPWGRGGGSPKGSLASQSQKDTFIGLCEQLGLNPADVLPEGVNMDTVDGVTISPIIQHLINSVNEGATRGKTRTETPGAPTAGAGGGYFPGGACPQCGSGTWDNRQKKASGQFKSTGPDFVCKEKCGWILWPNAHNFGR